MMAVDGGALLLQLVLVLAGAKLGAEVFRRLGQPALVGEIMVGLLLGPSLLSVLPDFLGPATTESTVLLAFAEIGVLLLLFEVGLETDLQAFRRVGPSAGLVGLLGVVFSLGAGYALSAILVGRIPWIVTATAQAQPQLLHIFIGAALAATSVGITARVLSDMGRSRTPEGLIILGAAVFDDVLGLIVLALVSGLVGGSLAPIRIATVLIAGLGFFLLAIAAGGWLGQRLLRLVGRTFKADYAHLGFAVLFMLFVSWLATLVGLAPIVGAFAAGLALNSSEHRQIIFEHVKPVGSLFVSFFFVVLGARIDLRGATGATTGWILIAGLALTLVGTMAKLGAGLGVVGVRASRYVVGIGMVPRGEVGLIFAVFGLDHGLITNWQYTCLVLVVLLTTLITPLWLKASARRFSAPMDGPVPHPAHPAAATRP
jgi:Kef-type K+ transport system membrane component KefB